MELAAHGFVVGFGRPRAVGLRARIVDAEHDGVGDQLLALALARRRRGGLGIAPRWPGRPARRRAR